MGSAINTTAIWNMAHRVGVFETQVFGSWVCVCQEAQRLVLSWAPKKGYSESQDLCNPNVTETEYFGNGLFKKA